MKQMLSELKNDIELIKRINNRIDENYKNIVENNSISYDGIRKMLIDFANIKETALSACEKCQQLAYKFNH